MPRILLLPVMTCAGAAPAAASIAELYVIYQGLLENNIECDIAPVLLTATGDDRRYLDLVRQQMRPYDQVWLWCDQWNYPSDLLDYFVTNIPVRVALLHRLPADSQTLQPALAQQLNQCSHILAFDNADIALLAQHFRQPVQWFAPAIPEDAVLFDDAPQERLAEPISDAQLVQGWQRRLTQWLQYQPALLDHAAADSQIRLLLNEQSEWLQSAIFAKRQELWSLHQSYQTEADTAAVLMAMAAAVPVAICTQSPEQGLALFLDGDDVVVTTAELLSDRLAATEPLQRETLVINARNKLLVRHSARIRLSQMLSWLSNGTAPQFNQDICYRPDAAETLYYKKFFTEQRGWSQRDPNSDERSRWAVIEHYLQANVPATTGQQIAEIGCGRGWLSNLLSHFGQVTAIDPVADVINAAKQNFPQIRFLTGSAELLLAVGQSSHYDLLVCSEVIEHVPHAFKDGFARSLVQLVRPGGYLILSTPRKDILAEWTEKYGVPGQPTEDWLTEAELAQLFQDNGCDVIDLRRAFLLDIYQIYLFQKRH